MKWLLAVTLFVVGFVWCQDDVLNNLQTLQDNPDLQEKTEDVAAVIKDKCVKAGGESAFSNLEVGKEEFSTCIMQLIDVEKVKEEVDIAKKTGSMDEVFAKYCKKKPDFLGCLGNFTDKLDNCLIKEEKNTLKILRNLTETLVEFACYKDGDRLAMFIAQGGQKCLNDTKEELQGCFNKSVKSLLPNDFSAENIPALLVFGENECAEYTTLQKCVVRELEGCKDKTPANLMDALFKYIRKGLPCDAESQNIAVDAGPQQYYGNNIREKRDENEISVLQKENADLGRTIADRLRLKCERHSSIPEAYQNLEGSFKYFLSCASDNLFNTTNTRCEVVQRNTELCLESFLVNLKPCLSDDEDFFPKFIRDAVDSVLNYACEDDGRRLRDFKATYGLQCLIETSANGLNNCLAPVKENTIVNGEVIIEQSVVCETMGQMDSCVTDHLKRNCQQHETFRKLLHGAIQALNAPCAGNSIFLSNILLLGLICLVIQKLWT